VTYVDIYIHLVFDILKTKQHRICHFIVVFFQQGWWTGLLLCCLPKIYISEIEFKYTTYLVFDIQTYSKPNSLQSRNFDLAKIRGGFNFYRTGGCLAVVVNLVVRNAVISKASIPYIGNMTTFAKHAVHEDFREFLWGRCQRFKV